MDFTFELLEILLSPLLFRDPPPPNSVAAAKVAPARSKPRLALFGSLGVVIIYH